jgi:nucleotide-binding universal stress UspA family protein
MADVDGNRAVMVAVDKSPASERACQWAIDYVLRPGDVLHLVHCIDSPADYWVGPDDTAIVYSDPATDGRDAKAKRFVQDTFVPKLQGAPCQVEVAHTSGAVGEALCRRAKELDAQAVVMASHNKGPIQRLFLGSTSDYCVKHCAQPLIVIR